MIRFLFLQRNALRRLTLCISLLAPLLSPAAVHAQDSSLRFGGQIPPEVDLIYERGLEWLAQKQADDGAWKDGNQGAGVNGLCLMAFLASGEDPNFGRWAQVVRKAVRNIVGSQDEKTGYLPSSMYHHGFAMLALAEAYGAVDETLLWQGTEKKTRSLAETLNLAIGCASTSQKKNRWGGWRYSPDASDSDTSVTGAMLMGLLACRNAGMDVPDETLNAALEYMRRSTGRDGSVAYSGGIGGMGESMNRSCIATLVAAVSKQKDEQKFAATLKHITTRLEHREGSYPEYFRYYMAQALFQGDYEAWKKWNAMTVRQLHETQAEDGGFSNSSYSTAMSLLALALNYRFLPIYER
ncbi:MAG TPA: squalene--hopene cyclase [Verrucomicrobiales bacterium]|nr:squalene--hopene cyclase [Verrucomicrobiales bacterium]